MDITATPYGDPINYMLEIHLTGYTANSTLYYGDGDGEGVGLPGPHTTWHAYPGPGTYTIKATNAVDPSAELEVTLDYVPPPPPKPPILPDVSRLVSSYLRTRPEVIALVDDRVYTAFPAQLDKSATFVLVQRIGGLPLRTRAYVVDLAAMQLDAYGGPWAAAHELAETCLAALKAWQGEQPNDAGNVHGVTVGARRQLADETWTPPRPRYVCDFEVTIKPAGVVLAGTTKREVLPV